MGATQPIDPISARPRHTGKSRTLGHPSPAQDDEGGCPRRNDALNAALGALLPH